MTLVTKDRSHPHHGHRITQHFCISASYRTEMATHLLVKPVFCNCDRDSPNRY